VAHDENTYFLLAIRATCVCHFVIFRGESVCRRY